MSATKTASTPSADVERAAADEVESLAVGADAFAVDQDGYGNAASAQILRECGTTLRALLAEREAMRAKLLELAQACAECGGSSLLTGVDPSDGAYHDQPCPDCADIRELC